MGSVLLAIQKTVMKYAEIISKIAHVDVEVVDETLFRVAGTGIFSCHINENMASEGHAYQQVLQTGRLQVIYEPGKEEICKNCSNRDTCREEIEISMPIRLEGEIIGIIGLVGSTLAQKQLILKEERLYLELVEQIGEFIAVKAKEVQEMRHKNALLDTLDYTISQIDQGILLLGSDGMITMANQIAKQQLEIENTEGEKALIFPTGDKINNQTEYHLKVGKKEFSILGYLYEPKKKTKKYAQILIFRSRTEMQEKYYEMTSTVCHREGSGIIGKSRQMKRLREEIEQVAKSSSTVLITGESGTGKELVATAIWKESDRRKGRFVALNCAAIPEALLESELFGYVKGAFTGADPKGRMGKFELADKGVLFLDEIGDMPLYLQAKLLRVLQERSIVRIGSNQVLPIDVRIIAATNKNLKEMMKEKRFREDLYYRLNVIPLGIPPLRERREDIEELARLFAERYAERFEKPFLKLTEEAMEALQEYPWEGNVRELENVMEFMVNRMGEDGILRKAMLPEEFQAHEPQGKEAASSMEETEGVFPLEELERREICKALRIYGNTTAGKKAAAKSLGIGLATLYRKMESIEKKENSQNEKN